MNCEVAHVFEEDNVCEGEILVISKQPVLRGVDAEAIG